MTQYLLSVYMVEGEQPPPPEEFERIIADVDVFNEEVRAAGAWVFAGGLHPADVATVVRVHGDEVLTTDGPFAESQQHVGGFWIIEVADLDAALVWAEQGSRACRGAVEVRPFQDEPVDA